MPKSNLITIAAVLFVVAMIYLGVANLVFVVRHPWAATGHRIRCFPEMLALQHVSRQDCGE